MVFFLACIAVICFIAAGGFSLGLLGTVQTVQQQTVLYLGLGFTTLTFVVAAGLATLVVSIRGVERAIKAQNPPLPKP